MLTPYLLIFKQSEGYRQDILNYLDTCREVKNWYAFMPEAIFIISDVDAHVLTKVFQRKYPNRNFMITEIPVGRNNGWLNSQEWDFINHPKSSGRWPVG
jgi:hypothetical protein